MSTPSIAWQRLRTGNQSFSAIRRSGKRAGVPHQGPLAVVFRCADSDTSSEVLFDQVSGALMNISTWGHVIDTGVLAAAEYAVGTEGVPLIVVLGHDNCAAMRTALDAWSTVTFPQGAVRAVVEQAISSLTSHDAHIGTAEELAAAHVAHTGVSLLQKSAVIARAVDSGQAAIVCLASDGAIAGSQGRLRVCATFGEVSATAKSLLECG